MEPYHWWTFMSVFFLFFPLSITFSRFIHVVACISISFFFNDWVIFHHMTILLWVYFAKWNMQTEYQNWFPLEKLYWERESERKVNWWLIERIFETNYNCLKKTFMKVSVCSIRWKSFFVFLWNLHWNIDVTNVCGLGSIFSDMTNCWVQPQGMIRARVEAT